MNQPQAQIPLLSQYQGTQYIKQMEDVFLPPQPFTQNGFPRQAQALRPPQYAQTRATPHEIPLHRDFLPIHVDFNRYLFNKESGYTERDKTYPIYTTGFGTVGL